MPNLAFKSFFEDNFNFLKSEFIVLLAALIAPTVSMIFLIGILVFTDTFTGVWVALKRKGWNGFQSRVLSNGLLPKLIFYPIAILVSQAIENEFSLVPIMKVTGFLIMSFEFKSIGENYKNIFGVSLMADLKNLIATKTHK